jgi:8-oxo-dGTP pyrophosphatase MutT (NUDIX family)
MGMSAYFSALRAKVGADLLVIPGVSVLIWSDDGFLLLARESATGPWGLIGGAVEPDEAPEDAARREAFEEVGVKIEIIGVRAVLGGSLYRIRYDNGDEVSYVSTVYDARVDNGQPTPDFDEVQEIGWFSPEEMSALQLNGFATATLKAIEVLR